MKSLIALASVVALSVSPAFAAEGHVSQKALANMGLSGMKAMADSQGTHIRGLSAIAVAGGGGYSTLHGVGGSTGELTFYGAADTGKKGASASGDNAAISGDATTTITTHGSHVSTTTTVNVIGSGGFSSAKAGK
jgi:hypothetical protein